MWHKTYQPQSRQHDLHQPTTWCILPSSETRQSGVRALNTDTEPRTLNTVTMDSRRPAQGLSCLGRFLHPRLIKVQWPHPNIRHVKPCWPPEPEPERDDEYDPEPDIGGEG